MGTVGQGGTQPDYLNFSLPVPAGETKYSETVSNASKILQSEVKDGLTKMEAQELKSFLTLTMNNPELPVADKAILANFLSKLLQAEGLIRTGGSIKDGNAGVQKAFNEWMNASAVCDLFASANEIASILSKIAREESILRQSIGVVMISMAKATMDLTIAAGEARAQQHEAEAARAWLQFGCALGQLVVTSVSICATAKREAEITSQMTGKGEGGALTADQRIKARQSAQQEVQVTKEMANSIIEAIKSAVDAGISMKKAELERSAALSDGVKQLVDKIFQLLNDTYSMLGEDMKDQRNSIEKLFQMVDAAQRASGEIWRA